MARFPYPDLGGGGGVAGGFMQGLSGTSNIMAQNLQNQKLRYEMEKDKEERAKANMANQLSGFVYALNKDPAVAYGMIPDALWAEISKHPSFARFSTPEGRAQIRDNYSKLVLSMPNETNGGRFNVPQIKESLNVLLGDELNKGTADDGKPALKKEIASIYPNKDGSFFIELNVTRQDGSSYRAPLTTGRTSDPKDTVRPVNIEELADHLRVKDSLATYLEAKLIGLGDKEAEKRAYNQIKGGALSKALREMTDQQSVEEKRRKLAIAGLEAGVTPIEMAQLGPTAIPSPDYQLQQIGMGTDEEGNPVTQHVMVNKGVGSVRPVGKATPSMRGASGRLSGNRAADWQKTPDGIDYKETHKVFFELQKQLGSLQKERAKLASDIKTITTTSDDFGTQSRVAEKKANLDAIDRQIAETKEAMVAADEKLKSLGAKYSEWASGSSGGGAMEGGKRFDVGVPDGVDQLETPVPVTHDGKQVYEVGTWKKTGEKVFFDEKQGFYIAHDISPAQQPTSPNAPAIQAPPEVAPEIESHEPAPSRRRLVDTGKTQDGVRLFQDQDTREIVREDGKPVRRKQGATQYFGNAPVF